MFPLMAALLLLLLSGVKCEELTPLKTEVYSLEGSSVSVGYSYHKDPASDYFFWYRQYPGKAPDFLISHSGTGNVFTEKVKGLKIEVKQTHLHLRLSSAAVSDSAVYYCAVRPTDLGGYKLMFGRGSRLTVENSQDYEPSFYKLEEGDTKVCLAAGFSRFNKSKDKEPDLFKDSEAARISGDSLFNAVALMSSEEDNCPESEPESCDDAMKPDPKVNAMSLTVLCLRVLFVKTVAVNVLMTLKLWLRP